MATFLHRLGLGSYRHRTAVVGVWLLLLVGAGLGAARITYTQRAALIGTVFQWGWLSRLVRADSPGPLLSLTPILVIGVLFGLAMDYQVFLVSRIHEAHAHGTAPRLDVEALALGRAPAEPDREPVRR